MRYELLKGLHGRQVGGRAVVFRPGDVLELTDLEAAALGNRVRQVIELSAPSAQSAQEPEPKKKTIVAASR